MNTLLIGFSSVFAVMAIIFVASPSLSYGQIRFANGTALNMNSTQACKTLYEFANDTGPMSTVNDSLKHMQKQFMDSIHDPVNHFMPNPPRELVANCMGIQR